MDTQLLIDAIVRQTTVLIAALATSRGLRAPLSQVADQVFLELSRELEAQGVSRKVSADMFGLALRSYRRRIQRLKESSTARRKRGRARRDHYQALVRTLIARLGADASSDETGGSTYTLDVFEGHPLEAEVRGTLARLRRELGELWDRVEAENARSGLPPRFRQVVVYAGQSSREEEK